jgi:hypothetical protein
MTVAEQTITKEGDPIKELKKYDTVREGYKHKKNDVEAVPEDEKVLTKGSPPPQQT